MNVHTSIMRSIFLFLLPVSCIRYDAFKEEEFELEKPRREHSNTSVVCPDDEGVRGGGCEDITWGCCNRKDRNCWCSLECPDYQDCCSNICEFFNKECATAAFQSQSTDSGYMASLLHPYGIAFPTPPPTPYPTYETYPTPTPTPWPWPHVTGDPHVGNIRGEQFDIKRTGWHKLLQIPRVASSIKDTQYRVDVHVDPRRDICGELYIQNVWMSGNKVPQPELLNFTLTQGLLGAQLLVNSIPVEQAQIPGVVVSGNGQSVKVNIADTISSITTARAGCCYHYLNYHVSLSKTLDLSNVGGLLGHDVHFEAETRPWQCKQESVKFDNCAEPQDNLAMHSEIGLTFAQKE